MGSYTLRLLIQQGYGNIIASCRPTSSFDLVQDVKEKIQWVETNLFDLASISELCEDVEVIIHMAAMVTFDSSEKDLLYKTNVELTKNLVDIALEKRIARFVYISSIASLGRCHTLEIIQENSEWEESELNTDYAVSKKFGEMEVWRGGAEGLPIIILNPSLIIGAGFWKEGTPSIFNKMKKGTKMYPSGSNGVVDVRDVTMATYLALESPIENQRIIISSENISYKNLLTRIANALQVSPPTKEIPSFLISIYRILDPLLARFGLQFKGISAQQMLSLQYPSQYTSELSKELLGMTYRPIEETIQETANLFIESQKQGSQFGILK